MFRPGFSSSLRFQLAHGFEFLPHAPDEDVAHLPPVGQQPVAALPVNLDGLLHGRPLLLRLVQQPVGEIGQSPGQPRLDVGAVPHLHVGLGGPPLTIANGYLRPADGTPMLYLSPAERGTVVPARDRRDPPVAPTRGFVRRSVAAVALALAGVGYVVAAQLAPGLVAWALGRADWGEGGPDTAVGPVTR